MVIDKFMKKLGIEKEKPEEYVEIAPGAEDGRVNVRIEVLNGFVDTDRIQEMVRNGNVVFLRIRDLRQKDITELKRCVDRLRKTCTAMNGDIVGVDEDFLVITPGFARVYRG